MKPRSSLAIQRDVITAIFLREMKTRFTGYVLGNFWLVLEPLLMISIFVVLFGLRGRGEFGYAEPPVFVLAAFLPFKMLWQFGVTKIKGGTGSARQLAMFRQITLFDIYLTSGLVQFCLFFFVGTLFVGLLVWAGFDAVPRDVLAVLGYSAMLWLFGLSVGIALAMVSRFAPEINILTGIIMMPMLFLSAVFFPMTIIPQPYRDWLAYNPLVHAMEFIRESWLMGYESPVADLAYFSTWTVGMLTLALCQYSLNWRKVMAR